MAAGDLASLDPTLVLAGRDELAARLAAAFPALTFSRGVLLETVVQLYAVLGARADAQVEAARRGSSLAAIAADPAAADEDAVDALLSNYGLTRGQGAAATGAVTIVLDAQVPVVVPRGSAFTSGGVSFTTDAAFAARADAAGVATASDRALRPLGDGTFAFDVPVTAASAGPAGMLRQGAAVAATFPIPHLRAIYAAADFAGGLDPETNAALLARLRAGSATAGFAGRVQIEGLVRGDPRFARVVAVSAIGGGDPEMRRDRRSVFGLPMGGRCDLLVRTAPLPVQVAVAKVATLVDVTADGGVWQFGVAAGDAPGFYRAARVADSTSTAGGPGLAVVSVVRGFDLAAAPGAVPDVRSGAEAGFSPLQSATITVLDPTYPAPRSGVGTARRDLTVVLEAMPDLLAIQALVSGRGTVGIGGDCLVRAATPCYVAASFEVRLHAGDPAPDLDAIAAAVADAVNSLGFPGRLEPSPLIAAGRRLIADDAAVGAIDLVGRIVRPDGTETVVHAAAGGPLLIPDDPTRGVSRRTVTFLLDPRDVAITTVVVADGDS